MSLPGTWWYGNTALRMLQLVSAARLQNNWEEHPVQVPPKEQCSSRFQEHSQVAEHGAWPASFQYLLHTAWVKDKSDCCLRNAQLYSIYSYSQIFWLYKCTHVNFGCKVQTQGLLLQKLKSKTTSQDLILQLTAWKCTEEGSLRCSFIFWEQMLWPCSWAQKVQIKVYQTVLSCAL